MPMTTAAQGSTKPAPGVTTTRPATRPVHAPTRVGLPVATRSTTIQEARPAALETTELRMVRAATPSAAKPNQPNQRSVAPRATNGTLWGR